MKYYSLVLNKDKKEADVNIFGDIAKDNFFSSESNFNSYKLSKQLEEIKNVNTINVHISSYGGEVGEGLAIYNALKNHKAKVKTYCDGFACSIASVIFMAGDERIMNKASLLMIHNAWTYIEGNADQLRKQADDLDKITSASINAYLEKVNIDERKLKQLMNNETWLTYQECLDMGFATSVIEDKNSNVSQSVKNKLIDLILQYQDEEKEIKFMNYECQECGYIHDGELPEFFICPNCGADKEKFKGIEVAEELKEDEKTAIPEKENKPEDEQSEDEKENKENEEAMQKAVAFFNAIIGGIK